MRFFTSITQTLLLIILILASVVYANENKNQGSTVPNLESSKKNAPRSVKILAFGDSITAGYRLPQKQAWPALLQMELIKNNIAAEVINAGVSGDTSAQGLRRVDWVLSRGPYDLILLGLGANDGLRNLPLKQLEANLSNLVDRFSTPSSKVVLLGMKLPSNQNLQYRQDFEALYKKIATEKSLQLYPFLLEGVATEEMLNLDDQIHPNADGHKKIAASLAAFLKQELLTLQKKIAP